MTAMEAVNKPIFNLLLVLLIAVSCLGVNSSELFAESEDGFCTGESCDISEVSLENEPAKQSEGM